MPFSVRKIPDHEVIEVLMPRPYQPYDRLILRETTAGRTTWTVLDCEQQGDAWQVTAMRCLKSCRVHRRLSLSLAGTGRGLSSSEETAVDRAFSARGTSRGTLDQKR